MFEGVTSDPWSTGMVIRVFMAIGIHLMIINNKQ